MWSVRATPARAGCPKVLRRVGAPRPPALGHGEQLADVGLLPSESVNARNRPMSPAGNASGSRSSRIAICAVHSPMPGSARSCHTFRQGSSGAKDVWIRNNGRRERRQRRGAHRGIPSAVRSVRRHRSGRGKTWATALVQAVACQRRAAARHELPYKADSGGHRDLLTEHGPNGELEPVPRTWHPADLVAPPPEGRGWDPRRAAR